ncbi:MAG: hypothetical protein K2K50_01825, partial [Anaeroplasmataceae bacterium]|nr:hypothetical protein [Anaeroplasmataceae bacterium]
MKSSTTTAPNQDKFDMLSWDVTIDNKQTYYGSFDIDQLEGFDELKTILELVKALPMITQVIKENENKLSLMLSGVFPKVFDRESIEGGYKFTLDFNKVIDLVDKACSLKISELIDELFGEGVFEQIETIVPNLFDYTIDETMDLLESLGLTLVDLFDALDAMIKENMGEEYNLKAILVMISGKEDLDGTALEILRSPLFKDVTLKQLLANFELDTDELKPMLEAYIAMAKEYTLLDLLLQPSSDPATSEEINIKEILSYYMNEYGKDVDISIYTDVKGNLLRFALAGNVVIPSETETMEAKLDVEILPNVDLVKDYASLEEELKKKTAIDLDKFVEALSEAGYEIIKEDDKVVAFQKVETEENSDQFETGEKMYYILTQTRTIQTVYSLDDITMNGVSDNCGNWLEADISIVSEVAYSNKATKKYYEDDVLIHEELLDESVDFYSSQDSFSLYINLETNEYKLFEDQHDFVLDETKSKEPVDCTDIGELHYICSKCGKEQTTYYIIGHSNYTYEYEFLTEVKNCRSGVLVKGYCGKCKKLAITQECEYHYNIGYSIDLGDAKICEDHKLSFYDCPCGEDRGFSCDLGFDGRKFYCDTCGLTITVSEDTKLEGCSSITAYSYTFYINEEKITDLKYDIVKARHFYDQIECEILNNGIECYDGWVLTGHCKTCDQIIVEVGREHKTYSMKRIDLSLYGGEGLFVIQSCPCGLYYRISENAFFSNYTSERDQEGNIYYTCINIPSFIIKEEREISY